MGLCKDCKFWAQYRQKKGACQLATATDENPEHPSLAIAIGFAKSPNGVSVLDAVIVANLETAPEFGCIQFTESGASHGRRD